MVLRPVSSPRPTSQDVKSREAAARRPVETPAPHHVSANEYNAKPRPQDKAWRPDDAEWARRRESVAARNPPARGAVFTSPSKPDGFVDRRPPRPAIVPPHESLKRNVKTQNMWKLMRGAPSDTTAPSESSRATTPERPGERRARITPGITPAGKAQLDGSGQNIISNELSPGGDSQPRSTFKYEREAISSRAEREASYRGKGHDFEKMHGVRRHANAEREKEKFDQRFLRTNHVREKEAALRGGYNIVTGRIGQTPPPRPTAVDPTAAGGARKNGNGSKYFFRNLNSTFDRFS